MKIRSLLTAGVIFFAAFGGSAMAEGVADSVEVKDPYVRAVPPGQQNSASFMQLTNNSGEAHAVVAAESDVAETVELHTHVMDDGMMKMRQIEKVDLPAGEAVSLEPGGLHVMLIGLKQDLVPDTNVAITLVFDDGSKREITAPVRKMMMKMMKKEGMEHEHMQH